MDTVVIGSILALGGSVVVLIYLVHKVLKLINETDSSHEK